MDSSANLKQVGEVIETLIHIKDSLYSELTFEQKVSLEDACNLLSHHLGDFTMRRAASPRALSRG